MRLTNSCHQTERGKWLMAEIHKTERDMRLMAEIHKTERDMRLMAEIHTRMHFCISLEILIVYGPHNFVFLWKF